MQKISEVQLGKLGLTDSFISMLQGHFERVTIVKIHVLKNAGRDKKKVGEMSEEILQRLGENFTAKIIGFTIVVKKWRRAPILRQKL